jgi:hypothetical protein
MMCAAALQAAPDTGDVPNPTKLMDPSGFKDAILGKNAEDKSTPDAGPGGKGPGRQDLPSLKVD